MTGCKKSSKKYYISAGGRRYLFSIVIGLVLPMILCLHYSFAEDNLLKLHHADLFAVAYNQKGIKKVTDGAGRDLLLVPKGVSVPGGLAGIPKIEIPVKRVALESINFAAFFNRLAVQESIVGAGGDMASCNMKALKHKIDTGQIVYLGRGVPMDYERLKVLNPDVVFAGSWDENLIPKLTELNIPVAIIDCFQEKHPIGKMEWLKFLAAFYNKEADAIKIIDQALGRIDAISLKIATAENHPKVLCGGLYGGKVHVPSNDSVTAKMIGISGGDYVFKHLKLKEFMGGYGGITLEEFFFKGRAADTYVLETSLKYGITSIEKLVLSSELFADIKPVKNGNIWCSQPWYWECVDKMDMIIEDLASIFHPELFPGHHVKYFFKLPEK